MNNHVSAFDDAKAIAIIKESLQPIEPQLPNVLPEKYRGCLFPQRISHLPDIQCVLFDIYGTLFVSAAGDIGTGSGYLRGNIDEFALAYTEDSTGEELKHYFREEVIKTHELLFPVTPYPEVQVENIWEVFPGRRQDISPAEFALRYELAVNPVCPMPGTLETLTKLQSMGIKLGIISNAQFFTPLLFEACFGKSLQALGFTEELLIYSYKEGEAKPAPSLFRKAKDYLDGQHIPAEHCLYVGNDMLNDIYGAQTFGFKTALFAGDRRSLRLRENSRITDNTIPTLVLNDITNITDLLSGGVHVSP
ncbi:MAG: HAD family hydrolase [Treponema sp.]|jgi:putative hydrolase of the HAD superfamily|nr:HAD family hydrolase [Treponema sp.]